MNETDSRDTTFNRCLAKACMSKAAACCCKGKIFLPDAELKKIRNYLKDRTECERENFERCVDETHDGFALFDQENRCQFLDETNLCRLHDQGAKPSECFWWPMHVYVSGDVDESLEIRISESCCDAHLCLTNESDAALDEIESAASEIGHDLIRRFRGVYSGSYKNRALRKI